MNTREFRVNAVVVAFCGLIITGCGGGSSDSGGAVSVAPGGSIQKDTTTMVSQSGTYNLPDAGLTDIEIDCPDANVDVTATSPLPQVLATNCNLGNATIVGHAGGGTLGVTFNLGNGITVKVVDSSQLP